MTTAAACAWGRRRKWRGAEQRWPQGGEYFYYGHSSTRRGETEPVEEVLDQGLWAAIGETLGASRSTQWWKAQPEKRRRVIDGQAGDIHTHHCCKEKARSWLPQCRTYSASLFRFQTLIGLVAGKHT